MTNHSFSFFHKWIDRSIDDLFDLLDGFHLSIETRYYYWVLTSICFMQHVHTLYHVVHTYRSTIITLQLFIHVHIYPICGFIDYFIRPLWACFGLMVEKTTFEFYLLAFWRWWTPSRFHARHSEMRSDWQHPWVVDYSTPLFEFLLYCIYSIQLYYMYSVI